MTRLAIGCRVVVVHSDRTALGARGVVVRYAAGWSYPYLVRLDDGRMILTNDVGVKPIDTEQTA